MKDAEQIVPSERHEETPLYLGATAGMRLLKYAAPSIAYVLRMKCHFILTLAWQNPQAQLRNCVSTGTFSVCQNVIYLYVSRPMHYRQCVQFVKYTHWFVFWMGIALINFVLHVAVLKTAMPQTRSFKPCQKLCRRPPSPFKGPGSILSGQEEGAFGWVTVNYLDDRLKQVNGCI